MKFYKKNIFFLLFMSISAIIIHTTVNAATLGIDTGIYGDDIGYNNFEIGFTFNYWGVDYTSFGVSSNGWISLLNTATGTYSNGNFPNPSSIDGIVCPFFDDLRMDVSGYPDGKVLYLTKGQAPNRYLVIQYHDVYFFGDNTPMGTFEAIFYENSNIIKFQYRFLRVARSRGNSATIGIDEPSSNSYVRYSYNQSNAVSEQQAITFTPDGIGGYIMETNAPYSWVDITGLTSDAPEDNGAYASTHIVFSWAVTTEANAYRLDISTAPNESAITRTIALGNVTSYTLTENLIDGITYYARVASSLNNGATYQNPSSFSDGITIDLVPPTANKPQIVRVNDNMLLKVYCSANDDNDLIASYEIEVATEASFANILTSTTTNNANFYFPAATEQTFYARSYAFDAAGNKSELSEISDRYNIPVPYTMSVLKSGNGAGTVNTTTSGIDCGAICSHSFYSDVHVYLNSNPDVSSNFTGWSGACSGIGTCALSMNSDLTVTANFDIKTFVINANTVDGGSITPSGALTFEYGHTQPFNIIYNPDNYRLLNVVVDGVSQGLITSYTFTNIVDNHTITAYLEGINQSPTIDPIMDLTVNEKQSYSFTVSGTDLDLPNQNLTYLVLPNSPIPCSAQTITSESGIVWLTPTEANGPGVFTITVGVIDDGPGMLMATESFQVTVNEVIDPIAWNLREQTVEKGQALSYEIEFTDPNIPNHYSQFELLGTIPEGLTLTGQTIKWFTDHNTNEGQTIIEIATQEASPQAGFLTLTVTPDITKPKILFDLESARTSQDEFTISVKANEKLSYTPTLKVTDSEDNLQNVQADGFSGGYYLYKVNISSAKDGYAQIEGIAYDTSNNGTTAKTSFIIDHTKPEFFSPISGDLLGSGVKQIIVTTSEALASVPTITITDVAGEDVPITYNNQYRNQFRFTLNVEPDTPSGSGIIEILGVDLAGNPGAFSHTVEIDTIPPEFSFSAPQSVKAGYMRIGVESDELLPDIPTVIFQAYDQSYVTVPYPSINGKSYLFTCNIRSETPNGQANLTIQTADIAGNFQTKTQNILIDTIAPDLTITTLPNPPHGYSPIVIHAEFSEALTNGVTMFASLDGATPLPVTLSENVGNHYTWTCNSNDIAMIQLDATDMIGNATQHIASFSDIAISSTNFTLSSTPGNGNDITATARVINIGNARAENVLVQILKGSWGNQEVIQAFTVSLNPGESEDLSVIWTDMDQDDSGVIVVKIDPDNQLAEINENNNQAHHAPAIIASTVQRHTFHLDESAVSLGAQVYDSTTFQPVGYSEINLHMWLEDADQLKMVGPLTTNYSMDGYTTLFTPSDLTCDPGAYTIVWQVTGANYATTSYREAISLIRDFTITVQTPQTVYSRTSPVEITGLVEDTQNVALQNTPVLISLKSQYGKRYFTTETDENGIYRLQYAPQWNEGGTFEIFVQVHQNQEIYRANKTEIDILGLLLTCPHTEIDVFSGEITHSKCEIRNVGTTALTNVSITVTDTGSSISQWDLDQSDLSGTLSANQRVYVTFNWIAGQVPGSHDFLMAVSCDEGEYESQDFHLSVNSKNASVRFSPNKLEVTAPINGTISRNIRIINSGWEDAQNCALISDMPPWIYLSDINPLVGTIAGNKGLLDVGFGYLTKYSLIGRIGTDGQTIQLGTNVSYKTYTSGELYLRINESDSEITDNSGYLSVQINATGIQNQVDIQANDGWQATGVQLDVDKWVNVKTTDTWLTSSTASRDADGNGVKQFTMIWSPTIDDFTGNNGPFDDNIRLSGSNFTNANMIFRTWLISDEYGSSLFTLTNELAEPITDATVTLYAVNYDPLGKKYQDYTSISNANGRAQFTELPPGLYGYVIRSDEYEDKSGQITIRQARELFQSIVLKPNIVEIQFTVEETTIKDVYKTSVRVLYKTQDNPVLIGIPINRSIRPGSAVTGKVVLKNVGYTAAKNVVFTMPNLGKYVDMFFQVISGSQLVEKSTAMVDSIEKNEQISSLKYIIYVDSQAPSSYQFNGNIALEYSYVSTSEREHQGATIIPVSVKTPAKKNYFNIDPPSISKVVSQDDPIFRLDTDLWAEIGSIKVTNMGEDKAIDIQDPVGAMVKGTLGINFLTLAKTVLGLGALSPLSVDFSAVSGEWDFDNHTEPLDPNESAIMTVKEFNENPVVDVLTGNPFNILKVGVDLISGSTGFVGFKSRWESATGQISDWDYAAVPINIIEVRDVGGQLVVDYDVPDDNFNYPLYVPSTYPEEIQRYGLIPHRIPPVVWKNGYVIFDIKQEASFDRQAFNAELLIDNNSESDPLTNVTVRIEVSDENQNVLFHNHRDCEELFFSSPDLQAVDTIDGNGRIQPDTEAKSKWLIIPTREAGGKSFYLTAYFSWNWRGLTETLQSEPVLVEIDYQPYVKLEYFIQKTFESEVPFYLGVRAVNTGEAAVHNFSIQSEQPSIRWSNSLILNPFVKIIRSVGSENVVADNDLKIKIDTLEPGDSAFGFWEMSASPGGKVLDFRVLGVYHDESLGGQQTSLLDVSRTTYWIDHFGAVDDLEKQMVVLIPDTDNVPNCVLHLMNKNYEPVLFVSPTITENLAFDSNTMKLSIGNQPDADQWICTTVNNSMADTKRLLNVKTDSGETIDSRNIWHVGDEIHILSPVTEHLNLDFEDYNKTTSGELFLDRVQYSGKFAKAKVTVLDADSNNNPGEKNDVVQIKIGSKTETTLETIELTEAEPGVFTATFGFDMVNTPENGNIFVEDGNFFSVSYIETTNASGEPSQITRSAQWIANSFPVISQGDMLTVVMDEDGSPVGWSMPEITAVDADGDALTWTLAQSPEQGTATVSGNGTSPEVLIYTPEPMWSGTDQFEIKVIDSNEGEDSIVIRVSVQDVNDAPVIHLDKIQKVVKNSVLSMASPITITDEDAFGNALVITLATADGVLSLSNTSGLTIISLTSTTQSYQGAITEINNALTHITYTPTTNFSGQTAITVTVNDQGFTGPGDIKITEGPIRIVVIDQNQAPQISCSLSVNMIEDMPFQFTNIVIEDMDAADDPIQITLLAQNVYISFTDTQNLQFVEGDGISDQWVSFHESVANINTALKEMTLTTTTDYSGMASLTLIVNDHGYNGTGSALQDSASISITVLQFNDAPVIALPAALTMNEDESICFSATVMDVDASSNPIYVSLVSENGCIALRDSSNISMITSTNTSIALTGTVNNITTALSHIDYTPDTNFFGLSTITIYADDSGYTGLGGNQTASASVKVSIVEINDPPEISSINNVVTDEDVSVAGIGFTISDVDTPTDSLIVTAEASDLTLVSTLIITNKQALSLTPNTNQSGECSITISVFDGALTATTSFVLSVVSINDPPAFQLSQNAITVDEDFSTPQSITIIMGINPDDELSQSFTYSLSPASSAIASLTINETTGQVTIESIANQNGYQEFSVIANDGMSENNTAAQYFALTINAINDIPTFELSKDSITLDEDFSESQSITVILGLIPDDETGQSLTFSLSPNSSQIASISIDETSGQVSIDPALNQNGFQVFEVIANDGMSNNNTFSESFSLTINAVNDPPAFVLSTNAISINEDFTETQSITVVTVLVPEDETSQTLTFSLSPSSSTLAGITINENTGQISIDAILNKNGDQEFSVIANDGQSENNLATNRFSLTITAVNDPPSFELSKNSITVDEDFTESQQITVTLGVIPDDETGQSITFSLSPASTQLAGITINENTGQITIDAISDKNGYQKFAVIANDNMSENNTATEFLELTINDINDPPVFNLSKHSITLDEDFTESQSITVIVIAGQNPDDEIGQSFTYSLSPASSEIVSITINETTGQITMNAAANENGHQRFEVVANDGAAQNNLSSEFFELSITAVNDPPDFELSKDTIIIDEDFTESLNITTTLMQVPDDEISQSVTFSLSQTSSEIVSITINENTGQVTMNAISNKNGIQTFSVIADDGMSENNTIYHSFTLTVTSVNDPPVFSLSKQNITVDEDFSESQSITVVAGLIPDDETSQSVTYSLSPASSQMLNITINESTGQVSIDSALNQNGFQVFEVIANDGMTNNNTFSESFSLTINAVNDPPAFVLSTNAISINEDFTETQSITVVTVLVPEDETSQTLTFSLSPSSSTLAGITINENTGQISIDAILNKNGDQEFSVIANDGQSENNLATNRFSLTITAVNDPPSFELSKNSITVDEDFTESQQITVTLGVIPDDETGQSITFSLSPASTQLAGITINENTGQITIDAISDKNGYQKFAVIANDNMSENNTATEFLELTINDINDPPVFNLSKHSITLDEDFTESQSITVIVIAGQNPDDEIGQSFTYSLSPASSEIVSITINETTGQITMNAAANENGHQRFEVVANDGAAQNNLSSEFFELSITAVNDPPDFELSKDTIIIDEDFTESLNITTTLMQVPDDEISQSVTFSLSQTSSEIVSITINENTGQVTMNAISNKNGIQTFSVIADDGMSENNTIYHSFTLTVTSVNDPPVFSLSKQNITVDEDFSESQSITVIAGLIPDDETSQSITYSLSPASSQMLNITINETTGQVSIDSAVNQNGYHEFTVIANDHMSTNSISTESFSVTINSINDAPIFTLSKNEIILDEDFTESQSITVIKGLIPDDEMAQSITYSLSPNTSNIVNVSIDANTGQITLEALADQNGYQEFAVIADDGMSGNNTATEIFALTINDINDSPVFDLSKDAITIDEDFTEAQTITIVQGVIPNDEQSQTIIYSISPTTSSMVNITINENTGEISLNAIDNKNGDQTFVIIADDGQTIHNTAEVRFDLSIIPVNDVPVFSLSSYTVTVNEDFSSVQTITVTPGLIPEDEIGQTVAYNLSPASIDIANISIDPVTGDISIQSTSNQNGSREIEVLANDLQSENNIARQRFVLIINPVNDAPSISSIGNHSAFEDHIAGPLSFAISDVEDGLLSVQATTSDLGALPSQSISFCNKSSQSYSLTTTAGESNPLTLSIVPPQNVNGDFNIYLTVSDSEGLSDTTSFMLTYVAVNDAPTFKTGNKISVFEDSGTQIVSNWITDIDGGAPDESNQYLSFHVQTDNTTLFSSQPAISISGTKADLRFTPRSDQFGDAVVELYMTDDGGVNNGGVNQSTIQSFTISVTSVNDAPKFTMGADQTVYGNIGDVQSVSRWASGISPGPANESNQNVQFHTLVNDPDMFVNGQNGISISETGTLTYSPTALANTTVTVTVYLSDGQTENYTSGNQYFNITIKSRNREPSFVVGQDITVDEDAGEQTIQAWATNVSPGESNELNQTLTFQIDSITQPGIFTSMPKVLVSGTNGILEFTPAPDAHGSSTIELFLKDDGGTEFGGDDRSPIYSFDIHINSVNDSPGFVKGPDVRVKQNSGQHTITNWATQLSKGPADERNQTLTFHVADNSNPDIFAVNPVITSTGTLIFTPANTTGTSEISIYLSDNGGGNNSSATQTFSITVDATAPPEISQIDQQETAQDTPTDLIEFTVTDPDTPVDNLIISAVSSDTDIVANNQIDINGSGNNRNLTITPTANQHGTLTITVSVNDGNATTSRMFGLTIHPKPSASIGIADGYTTTGALPLAIAFSPTQLQNEITDWLWEFGDGTSSNTKQSTHSYMLRNGEQMSTYSVRLTVSGPGGSNSVEFADYITVYARANVNFVADGNRSGSKPFTVAFTNQSDVYQTASIKWYFGDGHTDTVDHPTHTYTQTGKYAVKLEVTDINGNTHFKQKDDYIEVTGREISGAVYHDTQPLENMIVEVWQDTILYGTTTTLADGTYILNDLPSVDRLIVIAIPPLGDTLFLRQYYQLKETRNSATRVSTRNSDQANINFNLELQSNKGITGQVRDSDGDGLSGIFVDIYSASIDFGDSTITGENGMYTFTGLKPSSDYIVSAWSEQLGAEYFYNSAMESVVSRNDATSVTPEFPIKDAINIIISSGRTITGKVTNDGNPLVDIWVSAWSESLETGNGALTDDNGNYTITGLKDSEYIVEIEPQSYPYQAYSLVTARSYATPVSVFSNDINFNLQSGTTISGKISDINDTPLANVQIQAWSLSKGYKTETLSDVSGRYTLLNMKVADDYVVMADAVDYPIFYYPDHSEVADATLINNSYGDLTNIDFKLDKGPVIHGIVFVDELYGNVQAGIGVNVWSSSVNDGGTVITDENGMFEICGLDQNVADYVISIWSPNFMPAFYHSLGTVYKYHETEAVAPSDSFRNIVLREGFNVSGTVSTQNNLPVGTFRVEAVSDGDYKFTEVIANNLRSVNYTIENLSPGIYTLEIISEDYADQSLQITVDNDLNNTDFLLEVPNRSISGTIRGLGTNENVDILVKSANQSVYKVETFSGTGEKSYEISGLKPSSDYIVKLITDNNLVLYYDGQNERNLATSVNILNSDAGNIDFLLPETTQITGTVYFPTSAQAGETIWIDAIPYNTGSGNFVSIQYSGETEVQYQMEDLMKGQYYISATSSVYKKQYYDNVLLKSDATIVDTRTQSLKTDIDFYLTKGAYISGEITYPDTSPAVNAFVYAMPSKDDGTWGTAISQSDGSYKIDGLDNNAAYIVYATTSTGNVPFYFNDDSTVSLMNSASQVQGNSPNINIVVKKGKRICGTVRNSIGRGIDKIWVYANSETNGSDSEITDSDGNYCIAGLPESNDYVVSVEPGLGSNYLSQSQSGISSGATSIDFILMEGFQLNGTVTAFSTSKPLSQISIELRNENTGNIKFTQTDRNGNYQIKGLKKDQYRFVCKPMLDDMPYVKSVSVIVMNSDKIFNVSLEVALRIEGSIIDKNSNNPIANASVSIISDSTGFDASEKTDVDGMYMISHLPDVSDYIMSVRAQGYVEVQQHVSAGSVVNFELEQGGSITGRVIDLNGPIENAFIEVSSELSGIVLSTATNANGDFEISGLRSSWNGSLVSDYSIKVYAKYINDSGALCDYSVQTKTGKQVGDNVNFIMVSNVIKGTVSDSTGALMPANTTTQVSIMLFQGVRYIKTISVSNDGFVITGVRSDVLYTLYVYPSSTATGFPPIESAGTFKAGDIVNFQFDTGVW
jgi:hypothetical protein